MVLKDFILQNGTFALQETAWDWEDAVKLGVDLLCKAGVAEPRYYDAIIRTTDELGPY